MKTVDARYVIQELEAMEKGSDEEVCHSEADHLLCQFLRFAGYPEVARAFEAAKDRVPFWYA